MGYACTAEFDPTSTLPPPEFFGLPKIALIRRGSPNANQTCTFRTKLINAQKNNSIAAIVYNGEAGMSLDYATAALESDESPLNIPGMLITLEDGTMLKTLLEQTQGGSGTETLEYYNRVRVKLAVEHKAPVIWEFILIVVVVLLAVSFAISGTCASPPVCVLFDMCVRCVMCVQPMAESKKILLYTRPISIVKGLGTLCNRKTINGKWN